MKKNDDLEDQIERFATFTACAIITALLFLTVIFFFDVVCGAMEMYKMVMDR